VNPFTALDLWLAKSLPGAFLKDFYPRAMRRLAEYGLPRGARVAETKHGFRMNADRLEALKWYVHYFGEYEPQITAAWQRIIPRGGTVIDIGGNVGFHAMLASRLVGDEGRVLTFEPGESCFRQLLDNIRLNDFTNIDARRVAVSDQTGTAELFLLPDNDQMQSSLVWREGVVRAETVETVAFGDIMRELDQARISLIKIDVEGLEAAVVASLAPWLDCLPDSCVLFIEIDPRYDPSEVLRPLLENGFHVRRIANEYATAFYRAPSRVQLSELAPQGTLQDTVLCRDIKMFDQMERDPGAGSGSSSKG